MRMVRVGFGVALLAITVLSLLPIEQPAVSPNDKVNHLLGWGLIGLLGGLSWPRRWRVWPLLWGYSWLIEVAQGLTGYRLFSIADGFANLAGLALAVVLLSLWYKMRALPRTGARRPE
ncbi:VanZ family protein [Saccharospirillum mangrovi]|uniref:VanZ family protein n=1 Tax=Saccharospirillum mangrovi TaxID=2161747 RepID=UPI000E209C9F|nr:VanZ family protein [Saccharospirillum mangrovi]